ncbi:MAG: lactate racemase domain-containing protein [Myxococcota bacterium]
MESENLIRKFAKSFTSLNLPSYKQVKKGEILNAVDNSLNRFLKINSGAKRVTLCVTDGTRAFPEREFLPFILKSLFKNGIPLEGVRILVATGLHRHLSTQELKSRLGVDIVRKYKIFQNDPYDGVRVRGEKELFVNRLLLDSDIIIGTGIFEPHQYAGFSGGDKIFIIGCGGKRTIDYTHSHRMILKKGVKIGNVKGNPFRGYIERAARLLPPRWVLNIVKDPTGRIISFDCGEPSRVFERLYIWYRENLSIEFCKRFDAAFVVINKSKGINLYQASRGATYLALSESPVIKRGAPIILCAGLEEGFGGGASEEEFFRILSMKESNKLLLKRLKLVGNSGGGQRALMLLMTLLRHRVIVTGYNKKIDFHRENLLFIPSIEEAIRSIYSEFRIEELLFVRDPFFGLPRFSEGGKYGK